MLLIFYSIIVIFDLCFSRPESSHKINSGATLISPKYAICSAHYFDDPHDHPDNFLVVAGDDFGKL